MSINLNLGSHGDNMDGFVNIDIADESADIKADVGELPYEDNSVDFIYASHILEHALSGDYEKHLASNINKKTVHEFLSEWYRVLKPGGLLEIKVPDFDRVVWLYNNFPQWSRSPGGNAPFPAAFDWLVSNGQHGAIFNYPTLKTVLITAGFKNIQDMSTPIQAAINRENIEIRVICQK